MLRALALRDFVLVEQLRLEPHPGLNVLSGETGAGKSLLVDALGLLIGVRADAGLVRRDADRALVEAEFDGSPPQVASRSLVPEGRNHARLDGELVTVAELAAVVGERVSVFAQHAHQALLSPTAQRAALDRLLDDEGRSASADWHEAWQERREVVAELERLRDAARSRLQRADLLDLQLAEIDAAELTADEEEELSAEARRLRHADRIAGGLARAMATLDGDGGAAEALQRARRELDEAAGLDPRLVPLATEIGDALTSTRAIAAELEGHLDTTSSDPGRLDRVESRLAALQRLFAKYGDGSAAVLAFRDRAARERAELDAGDRRIVELDARREELEVTLEQAAGRLRSSRRRAADRLATEIEPLLGRLALAGAQLSIAVDPVAWGPSGADRIRFDFAANPGERLAPLASAASGGELSRVMLALWLVTGSDAPTLVFDEVDAGVGGRAATAVGELLAQLARRHQVLVVTHLAQVAAHADRHVLVGKEERAGRTTTVLVPLEGEAREVELARMLAGHEGDAARATARDLLSRAGRLDPYANASSPSNSAATSERSE